MKMRYVVGLVLSLVLIPLSGCATVDPKAMTATAIPGETSAATPTAAPPTPAATLTFVPTITAVPANPTPTVSLEAIPSLSGAQPTHESSDALEADLDGGAGGVLLVFGIGFIYEIYQTVRPGLEQAGHRVVVASHYLGPFAAKGVDFRVQADLQLSEVRVVDYEAVAFLCDNDIAFGNGRPETDRIVQEALQAGKVVAAICAAPRVLGYAGVVQGIRVTAEPSQTCQLLSKSFGATCTGAEVERDGLIITARDRYARHAFVQALLLAMNEQMTGHLSGSAAPSPTPTREIVADPAALGDTRIRPSDGMVMLFVPGGEFRMGSDAAGLSYARELCIEFSSDPDTARATCQRTLFEDERPAHIVALDGFWIDRTEVTVGQYRRCVEAGLCTPPVKTDSHTRDTYFDAPAFVDYPVVWVSWVQAVDYCGWAGGRLPTEAEWEYAGRGPEELVFPWGDAFDGTRLNYCDANCTSGPNDVEVDDGYPDTAPVGSYPTGASWCGALDLAGNVREWVADWYGLYPSGRQVNPAGPPTGDSRIPRGGSWLDTPDDVRGANRGANAADYTRHKVGFRCVVPVPAGEGNTGGQSCSPTVHGVPDHWVRGRLPICAPGSGAPRRGTEPRPRGPDSRPAPGRAARRGIDHVRPGGGGYHLVHGSRRRRETLIGRITRWNPQVLTAVGRHHATVMPEDSVLPSIDLIVRGEGVEPFTEIVHRSEKGDGFDGIPGFAFLRGVAIWS